MMLKDKELYASKDRDKGGRNSAAQGYAAIFNGENLLKIKE